MSQSERNCDRLSGQTSATVHGRVTGTIVGLMAVVAMAIANAPYRYVESGPLLVGSMQDRPRWANFASVQTPVQAGWPLRYSVQYELSEPESKGSIESREDATAAGRREWRWWSTPRLLLNVLFTGIFASSLYWLTQYRDRVIRGAFDHGVPHARRTRQRLDVAGSLTLVLIPLGIVGFQAYLSFQEMRLARRIANHGTCYLAASLPEPIANRIPSGCSKMFARIRYVRVDRPGDDVMRDVVQIPTLVGLRIGPGEFDHRLLKPLGSQLNLCAVVVRGGRISATMLDCLADCPWLLQLDLSQSELEVQEFRRLDSLSRLRWVDLSGTSLRLADLGQPEWSKSISHLRLPMPKSGHSDRLKITDWPKLRELALISSDPHLNPEPLELHLSNLPVLRRLLLNSAQKIALYGENLPQLTDLRATDDLEKAVSRLQGNERLPRSFWFSDLKLCRVPSLTELRCCTRDLKTLSLQGCRRLKKFELSSETIGPDGALEREPTARQPCQEWIDQLGAVQGPADLTLAGLSLEGVDLSPLAKNRKIRRLNLQGTSLSFQQIRGFITASHLEELVLDQCPLTADQLSWLLEACPSLERVSADLTHLTRLEIVENEQLTALLSPTIEHADQVRLVDLPRLQTALHFRSAPRQLQIRNMPKLQGLMVTEAWPTDAAIEGLRELRWLAVGGRSVGDETLASLLDCDQLNRLSIAYGSLSKESLAKVGRFERLITLELPGAAVDDSVVRHWRSLKQLQHVCLDDTTISGGTLAWLSKIDTLRSLSINRVRLNADASEKLVGCHQLCDLRLRDAEIDARALCQLLSIGLLESLDVAGHPIDDELFHAIARCTALNKVVMSPGAAPPNRIQRLLDGNGHLTLEFVQSDGISVPIDALALPESLKTMLKLRQANAPYPRLPRPQDLAELAGRVRIGVKHPTPPDPFRGRFAPHRFRPPSEGTALMSAANLGPHLQD